MDKPWSPGVSHTEQTRYQIILECAYWNVLGYFNNWDIIKFTTLMRFISFSFMESVKIWLISYKQVSMM